MNDRFKLTDMEIIHPKPLISRPAINTYMDDMYLFNYITLTKHNLLYLQNAFRECCSSRALYNGSVSWSYKGGVT